MEKDQTNQTTKNIVEVIKNNKDLITFIGPYLIMLGVLRFYAYYAQFKINILNYLDFSEFITSFFGLSYIIIGFFLLSMTGYFIINIVKKRLKIKSNKKISLAGIILLSFIFSAIPSFLGWFIIPLSFGEFLGTLGAPAIFVIAMGCLLWVLKTYFSNRRNNTSTFIAAATLISLMIFDYNCSKIEAKYVLSNSTPRLSATILLDSDKILCTSDSLLFVGKTKSFVFLYEPNAESKIQGTATTIIDLKNVKQIRLTQPYDSSRFNKWLGNSIFKNNFW